MSEPKILTLNLNYFPKISLRLKLEEQTWKLKKLPLQIKVDIINNKVIYYFEISKKMLSLNSD